MYNLLEMISRFRDKITVIHRSNWKKDLLIDNETKTRDQSNNRLRLMLLVAILAAAWAGNQIIQRRAVVNAEELQKGIAQEVIRFHVIANSDCKEDQSLKIKVKNSLVQMLSPYLKNAEDITEGREILLSKMDLIQSTAEEIVKQNGYQYSITVTLEPWYFPIKVYGDYTFPPGTYEALRVQIGEAEGKNWWCVMFPPLCFVDETYNVVDKNSDEEMKCLLTEEEYQVLKNEKAPVKVKFKLLKSVKKLFYKKK